MIKVDAGIAYCDWKNCTCVVNLHGKTMREAQQELNRLHWRASANLGDLCICPNHMPRDIK